GLFRRAMGTHRTGAGAGGLAHARVHAGLSAAVAVRHPRAARRRRTRHPGQRDSRAGHDRRRGRGRSPPEDRARRTTAVIDRVESFPIAPRWLFVRIETSDGVVGWGEASLEGYADVVRAAV